MIDVTILLATCDRYDTTLPLCLMSLINQTHKPKRIVLVDDNKDKKFYDYEILRNILTLCKYKDITFDYYHGPSKGGTFALDLGLSKIDGGWILKVDDDNVLNPDVIELYVKNIKDNIGAMGGLILDSKSFELTQTVSEVYNKISEVFSRWNIQMIANQTPDIKKVEHIYSNYFFKKQDDIRHDLNLTPSCHREETIFTHEFHRKGFDLIVIPQSVTYHLNYNKSTGNNRHSRDSFFKNELVFIDKLKEWEVVPQEFDIIEKDGAYVTTNSRFGDQDGYLVFRK